MVIDLKDAGLTAGDKLQVVVGHSYAPVAGQLGEAGGNTGGGAVVKGLDPRFMHFLLHMEVEDLGTLMNTIIEVFTEVDVVLSLDGILMVQVQD